jgi:hypothetical protein
LTTIRAHYYFGPVEPLEFGVEFLALDIADFGRMPVEAESGAGVAHGEDDVAEFINGHFMPTLWCCGAWDGPAQSPTVAAPTAILRTP